MHTARRYLGPLAAAAGCLAAAPRTGAVSGVPGAAVTIDTFTFGPAQVTVAAGATVTWTNCDDMPHTVAAADTPRLFGSDPIDTGDTFTVRFDHAGRFAYLCTLHSRMQGVVVVR